MIIFGVMPFGLHYPVKVMLLSCHQSRVWIDYIGDIDIHQTSIWCTFPFSSIGFWYQRSEKCKSVSPRAVQLKNQQKTVGIEEKLDIISQLEKGE